MIIARTGVCRGTRSGGYSAAIATRSLHNLARDVNVEVLRLCSLWARRESRVIAGGPNGDMDIMLLAARHLGLPDSAHLWRLTPQRVPGKLPTASNHSRIVYQDGVDAGRGGPQNDIWLGHARFRGYLTIKVDLPSKCDNLHGSQNQRLLEWIDSFCSESARDDITSQMLKDVELESRGIRENVNPVIDATTLDKNVTPHNPASNESQNGSGTFGGNEAVTPWGPDVSITDTTIFVYPYTRGNSQVIVDALHRYRGALEEADLRSLVYLCGSTGSSRALRLLGHILRENCRGRDTPSAIHRVEEHAWPWMKHDSNEEITKFGVPLVLDALSSAAVIQYTFENESAIFDYIASELQKLDSKVKDTEQSPSEELKLLDESILRRALQLLILKRNFSHLNCDHIRVFSDFICDRLHRIDPRSIANLSFALGHSKHLDEFWMFMMAKRIQDNPQEFGPDEIAAIMDAYSNACLEDHEFYSVLCQQISREIDRYGIEHLTVILRSLARVRVRDEWLLNYTLEKLASHLNTLGHQCKSSEKELAYITANCIVAAGDLDYAGDCNFDAMWRLLTSKIKQSSFDICAINWLPLAAMTFASRTTLQTFMPVWLRHVAHTIQKLRSKTFVLTIQRRHHLVRHVFKLGILPRHLLPRNAQRILDDICDCEHVTERVPEEYVPESSTFHLEVCACLRALDVAHQREIRIVPFVMDIVVPPKRAYRIKPAQICEANRLSDKARSGQIEELSAAGFRLKYTRHSPNHRKRKQEVYVYDKK